MIRPAIIGQKTDSADVDAGGGLGRRQLRNEIVT
jgi:hypothetical protein